MAKRPEPYGDSRLAGARLGMALKLQRYGFTAAGAMQALRGQPIAAASDRMALAQLLEEMSQLFTYQLDMLSGSKRT